MNKTIVSVGLCLALCACNPTGNTDTEPTTAPEPAESAGVSKAGTPKTYERWAHLHTSAQIEAIKECPSSEFLEPMAA